MPDTNPIKHIAIAEIRQRTKKTSWRKKASEDLRSILGSTQLKRTAGVLPLRLQTGNNVFEVDGAKSGETEKDKI